MAGWQVAICKKSVKASFFSIRQEPACCRVRALMLPFQASGGPCIDCKQRDCLKKQKRREGRLKAFYSRKDPAQQRILGEIYQEKYGGL